MTSLRMVMTKLRMINDHGQVEDGLKLRMIMAKFMTKWAGGDGAATVGCI